MSLITKKRDAQETKDVLAQIGAAGIATCLLVAAFYLFYFRGNISLSQEKWAQFGDYFGGVAGPILSLFALIALLITIVLQLEQLELSRNELEETRKELNRSASAQEQSQQYLADQALISLLSTRINVALEMLESDRKIRNHMISQLRKRPLLGEVELSQEEKDKLRQGITDGLDLIEKRRKEIKRLYKRLTILTDTRYEPHETDKS